RAGRPASGGPAMPRWRWHRSRPRPRCGPRPVDRKSTRLNSSHVAISYAVFCLKKKIMVYPKSEGKVISVVGQGWTPAAVSVDWYRSRNKTLYGSGLDPAVVPGAVHATLTVLEKWGTMSFEEVAGPANEYAHRGFALGHSSAQ